MPNLQLVKKKRPALMRKIALGTWATAYDPSIYGSVTLRVKESLRYQEAFRKKHGKNITISHLMAKAVAAVLLQMPDANAIVRFNRIYLRKDIGVFFQVILKDEQTGDIDLSGLTIHDADKKSLAQIYDEFQAQVEKVRNRTDTQLEASRNMFRVVPYVLLNFYLKAVSFLAFTLNLDLRALGMPKDPFGSVMVTNVGTLGLEAAYAPLVPYSRVPIVLALSAIKDEAVVVDGKVEVEPVLHVYATLDHRIVDGGHAATMTRVLREWLESPFTHFDDLG
jgi:pyruvate/2-oxoglutarate dehydrogenase complex dihydrolipoamide acyltransferase (E2) component